MDIKKRCLSIILVSGLLVQAGCSSSNNERGSIIKADNNSSIAETITKKEVFKSDSSDSISSTITVVDSDSSNSDSLPEEGNDFTTFSPAFQRIIENISPEEMPEFIHPDKKVCVIPNLPDKGKDEIQDAFLEIINSWGYKQETAVSEETKESISSSIFSETIANQDNEDIVVQNIMEQIKSLNLAEKVNVIPASGLLSLNDFSYLLGFGMPILFIDGTPVILTGYDTNNNTVFIKYSNSEQSIETPLNSFNEKYESSGRKAVFILKF